MNQTNILHGAVPVLKQQTHTQAHEEVLEGLTDCLSGFYKTELRRFAVRSHISSQM